MRTCFRCGPIDTDTDACPRCGREFVAVIAGTVVDAPHHLSPRDALAAARVAQRREGGSLAEHMLHLGVDRDALSTFIADAYGVPHIDLSAYTLDPVDVARIPRALAERFVLVAVNVTPTAIVHSEPTTKPAFRRA